uniref:Isopenicillin N synthase-like Fe(2+) 2OG dioxygenase domain-containing protein n=1 Tax=Aegilops tauschii subsp. strangulata TaxID=200361 RepID=A0A453GIY0_AEGTS
MKLLFIGLFFVNFHEWLLKSSVPKKRKEKLGANMLICSDTMFEYAKQVMNLGNTLFELLSEALGLDPSYLTDIDCNQGQILLCHYFPPCPQPELAIGTSRHSDSTFMTILLQDEIGGLQILHED